MTTPINDAKIDKEKGALVFCIEMRTNIHCDKCENVSFVLSNDLYEAIDYFHSIGWRSRGDKCLCQQCDLGYQNGLLDDFIKMPL